jgi:hypothetical protein
VEQVAKADVILLNKTDLVSVFGGGGGEGGGRGRGTGEGEKGRGGGGAGEGGQGKGGGAWGGTARALGASFSSLTSCHATAGYISSTTELLDCCYHSHKIVLLRLLLGFAG